MHKYYPPNQGYHAWHEDWSGSNWNRHIVLTMYLNDVKDGGETEFLYQNLKITPEKGLVIAFPPYYTHVHKGHIPISNSKYIVTTWFSFASRGNGPHGVGFYIDK